MEKTNAYEIFKQRQNAIKLEETLKTSGIDAEIQKPTLEDIAKAVEIDKDLTTSNVSKAELKEFDDLGPIEYKDKKPNKTTRNIVTSAIIASLVAGGIGIGAYIQSKKEPSNLPNENHATGIMIDDNTPLVEVDENLTHEDKIDAKREITERFLGDVIKSGYKADKDFMNNGISFTSTYLRYDEKKKETTLTVNGIVKKEGENTINPMKLEYRVNANLAKQLLSLNRQDEKQNNQFMVTLSKNLSKLKSTETYVNKDFDGISLTKALSGKLMSPDELDTYGESVIVSNSNGETRFNNYFTKLIEDIVLDDKGKTEFNNLHTISEVRAKEYKFVNEKDLEENIGENSSIQIVSPYDSNLVFTSNKFGYYYFMYSAIENFGNFSVNIKNNNVVTNIDADVVTYIIGSDGLQSRNKQGQGKKELELLNKSLNKEDIAYSSSRTEYYVIRDNISATYTIPEDGLKTLRILQPDNTIEDISKSENKQKLTGFCYQNILKIQNTNEPLKGDWPKLSNFEKNPNWGDFKINSRDVVSTGGYGFVLDSGNLQCAILNGNIYIDDEALKIENFYKSENVNKYEPSIILDFSSIDSDGYLKPIFNYDNRNELEKELSSNMEKE